MGDGKGGGGGDSHLGTTGVECLSESGLLPVLCLGDLVKGGVLLGRCVS